VFVGVDLSDDVRAAVAAQLAGFSPLPGRPSPPQNWHITLRFLGQTTPSRLEVFRQRLDESQLDGPFPLRLGRLGAFPRAAASTVLWLGCDEGAPRLGDLAAAAEDAAVAAGFSAEERPFHPHVTLSRIRPHRDLRSWLDAVPPLRAAQTVDEISVYRSHLGGTGPPRYEIIDRVALAGG
jgi:2'-5' RNA ligase